MNLQKFGLLAIVGSVIISTSAHAAVDCVGNVTSLSLQLNSEGAVTVSLSGGPSYAYLCNINGQDRNGVNPAVCKTMYATLMAAKLTNKKVGIRFYDYDSCQAIPTWANSGALGWTQLLID